MIWLTLALLTTMAAAAMVLPLVRRTEIAALDPVAPYRSQLTELKRDMAMGLIGEAEGRAVELEIQRRMLAADAAGEAGLTAIAPRLRQFGIFGVMAAMIGAVTLYLAIGSPQLVGVEPPVERQQVVAPPATPEEMVQRLSERLFFEPEDGAGWALLGRSLLVLEREQEGFEAYQRALSLLPDNPVIWAEYGGALLNAGRPADSADALRNVVALAPDFPGVHGLLGRAIMAAEGGRVTPEARAAFSTALDYAPQDLTARFFLAEGLLQDGDVEGALAAFRALLEAEAENEELRQLLAERIAMILADTQTSEEPG